MNTAAQLPRPATARLQPPLAVGLAVAVLHAALLLRPAGETHAPSSRAIQVRLVQAPAHAAAGLQPPAPPQPAAAEPAPAAQPPSLFAAAATMVSPSWLSSLWSVDGAGAQAAAAGDDYRPRAELTTPPQPTAEIRVLYPEAFEGEGDYSIQLSLFIDETGVVRRVRVDTPGLPPTLQDAASEAFLNAHFEPGQVDGRAVKSMMRVEVAFENRPA